jgi:hypothetical protein
MSRPIEEVDGRMLLVLIDGVGPLLLISYRRNILGIDCIL